MSRPFVGVLSVCRGQPSILLRTPISAKYCWFGWWLGAWSTSSHHPTQLCDIYISGYKYTLISEWTRLFGLLRILDNLIAGAVCYFCTTISVFCEIYILRMRVVAHAAIVWVGWYFMPSSGAGLVVSVPITFVVFSWLTPFDPHEQYLDLWPSRLQLWHNMACPCRQLCARRFGSAQYTQGKFVFRSLFPCPFPKLARRFETWCVCISPPRDLMRSLRFCPYFMGW